MTSRGSLRLLHLAIIVATIAALGRGEPSAQSSALPWAVQSIGSLGGSQSAAYDVGWMAQAIVGRAQTTSGAYHAFSDGDQGRLDLGTLGGRDSTAFAVSGLLAVGQAQTASGQYHAFAFSYLDKVMTDLGTLGGTWSAAYDTDSYTVVGASRTAGDARIRAFQFVNGLMTALTFDTGGDSAARGVNNATDIVGYTCAAGNSACRPFLSRSGVLTMIGPAGRTGVANRVNDAGVVVGAISVAAGATTTHAFRYADGVLTDLGTLGGGSSEARGINERGDIVGSAHNAASQPRAFLWRNGQMIDLNTLVPAGSGWVLESAAGISEDEQIVGYGSVNGKRRAFLLTPPTDLRIEVGGSRSQSDSNLPRGIEVGRHVRFYSSVLGAVTNTGARFIYGARTTHTLTGPAVFVDADAREGDSCDVKPTIVVCTLHPVDTVGVGREVSIRARATAPGAITHHATLSGDVPDPNSANNTTVENNRAVALATFTLTPASVAGGQTSTAEMTLTDQAPAGDAVVTLTSSRPEIAPVPATFVVPSWTNKRNFHIVPAVVSAPTTVQISATYGLVTVTKTLTVVPPALKQLYLTPTTVIGGCGQSQGRVVLSGAAPSSGAVVPLTNSNTKATVPANVTIPAGSDSVPFTVSTVPVTAVASGVVTAAFGGVSQSLNFTVRPIRAQTLALASARVRGGTTVSGTVTLECPAVPGAIAVSFTSSDAAVAAATVPNITIPAGATTGTFSVRTSAVTSETAVTIYAWVFGVRKGVTLTVTP